MLNRDHPLRIGAGLLVRLWRYGCNYLRIARLRRRGLRCDGQSYIDRSARIANPANVSIGRNCFIGRCVLYALDRIEIGDRTIIGERVFLCTGTHDIYAKDFRLVTKPIIVGRCVWIATGATILPGVRIGDGAVIGAMAVVSRDVGAGSVVVGNPARVVKAGRTGPLERDPAAFGCIDYRTSLERLRRYFAIKVARTRRPAAHRKHAPGHPDPAVKKLQDQIPMPARHVGNRRN